jgi:sugar lactone lactonase YvrE
MRVIAKVFGTVVLATVAVLVAVAVFETTNAEPVAWTPPPAPSMDSGPYVRNNLLAGAKTFGRSNLLQPESMAAGPDGKLYTGMNTGEIVRIDPDKLAVPTDPQTTPFELLANTAGRPLGMVFHPNGDLIVADGVKGLLSVSPKGEIKVLSTESEGLKFGFADDVAVSADGRYVWLSDATWKFPYPDFTADVVEHVGNGRLIQYDMQTGETKTLLKDLQFANGVAVSKAGDFVLVNETAAYRITRYWLSGPKAGQSDVFADNLPGFPDNVRTDADGNFWVATPTTRDGLIDALADKPAVRKFIAKLLKHIEFPVKPYAMALGFDANGKLIANLQAPKADGYYYITQVTPVGNKLYFNSVHNNGMAVIARPASQ